LLRPEKILTVLAVVLAGAPATMAGQVQGPPLQSHLAVYDLSLANAEDRSGITSATGRMVIEVDGSPCDGWTLNFRLVVQYGLDSGKGRLLDSRSNSWESGDGNEMRYARRQYVDNNLEEESLLTARRGQGDQPGTIDLKKPEAKRAVLAPGAVFPVLHQVELTRAARAGKKRLRAVIFDGGDDSAAYDAIAFIGAEIPPRDRAGGIEGSGVAALASLRSWPVSVSYYKQGGSGEETPDYQVSFEMFDNGVSGDTKLDYGDFALSGKLTRLDFHTAKPCP
jgi:hypothetical protein